MKVLIECLGKIESAPVFSYSFAMGLKANGVDIYAFLDHEIENKDDWISLLGAEHIYFFSHYPSKSSIKKTLQFLGEWLRVRSFYKEYIFDYIIHIFTSENAARLRAAIKCRKIVTFCHDPIPHSHVSQKDYKRTKKRVLEGDKIVVLSKTFVPVIRDVYGKPEKDIIFIRHGLLHYEKSLNEKTEYTDNYSFLFFGRIDPYKGLDILIEAYTKLKRNINDISLTIAGRGDIEAYKSQIQESEDIIVLNDYISAQEVARLFSRPKTVLVLPYKDATQSGVATIAFDFCIPVIYSDTGALKEQFFDGTVGIAIPPNDVESLISAMGDFCSNPSIYTEEVKKMTMRKKELSWENIARRFLTELTD